MNDCLIIFVYYDVNDLEFLILLKLLYGFDVIVLLYFVVDFDELEDEDFNEYD